MSWPVWDGNTQKELLSVLDSGRWAISGQWKGEKSKCEKFEEEYAKFNKSEYCLAFDHGSSSIVSALQALQIGPGDEVIVPALTWVACIIGICNVNAIPVVVDVDKDTYCISIDELKKQLHQIQRQLCLFIYMDVCVIWMKYKKLLRNIICM